MLGLESIMNLSRKLYLACHRLYRIDDFPKKIEELKIYKTLPEWVICEIKAEQANSTKPLSKELYLLSFNDGLTTYRAELRLRKMGFCPANFLETILFIDKYAKQIRSWPIISLNSYHDLSGSFVELFKDYKRPDIDLCICCTSSSAFERPGEIEAGEAIGNLQFRSGVKFLAKEIT